MKGTLSPSIVFSFQNNMNLLWNSHKTRSCEDTEPGLLVVSSFSIKVYISCLIWVKMIDSVVRYDNQISFMCFRCLLNSPRWDPSFLSQDGCSSTAPPSTWFSFYFPIFSSLPTSNYLGAMVYPLFNPNVDFLTSKTIAAGQKLEESER